MTNGVIYWLDTFESRKIIGAIFSKPSLNKIHFILMGFHFAIEFGVQHGLDDLAK